MRRKWTLGNLLHGASAEKKEEERPVENVPPEEEESAAEQNTNTPETAEKAVTHGGAQYLPEMKDAMARLWRLWQPDEFPPLLALTLPEGQEETEAAIQNMEREKLRISIQLEQDAKRRTQLMERGAERENFSMNSSCRVYPSRDKMLAWAFFLPPFGPDGHFEAGGLGKALQDAGVTTGIDNDMVVRLLTEQRYFQLIPIAAGTPPIEGKQGQIVELFSREISQEIVVDETGTADYRELNYVRNIEKDTHICNIIPPQEGTPGVQIDGKKINPQRVRAARVPKGNNTAISEDGLYLVAARTGHLEFANNAFHVRSVLDVRSDVDYSTGNINFNGDIHIFGDVREGFRVSATGTITIDGLVEAADIEAGGDLVISRGVVGDHRAVLRSGGCVRVKYLESCELYAGKSVHADCIMTSQIFSDESIEVVTGRGSVIGGNLTAAKLIRAKMVGAQSGRKTELSLGVAPYAAKELQALESELSGVKAELSKLEKNLEFLSEMKDAAENGTKLAKMKLRRSMLTAQEKKLTERQNVLVAVHPQLSKCRFEADMVFPITTMTIHGQMWTAKEVRRRCRLIFDEQEKTIQEII